MYLYSAEQIRLWDAYTIKHEPISSIELMERAAQKCVDWLLSNTDTSATYKIICGKGNNGGDGLAIARLLLQKELSVSVYILEFGKLGSDDFQANLQLLHEQTADVHFIQTADHIPNYETTDIIIDALFGSGLSRALEGLTAAVVQAINHSGATIISIDVPSGLYLDQSSLGNTIVTATHTLTFQCYKLGLLVAENAPFFGQVHVLDIGLLTAFIAENPSPYRILTDKEILHLFRPRSSFSHKGTYGHALLMVGSYGKIGAAVLAAKACLRSGVGLLTTYLPACGYTIMQTSVPEAMALTDAEETHLTEWPNEIEKYATIGIGPGIGTAAATQSLLTTLLHRFSKPMVIDADGLNCLAQQTASLLQLPLNSILTPHPKEFDRLFGDSANDFDRIKKAGEQAAALQVIIVLKGHHTYIALPDGTGFFNMTGNAGMATGGTGDVLTGIITGLLAQGYEPAEAAQLGVYIHGLSGDLAAQSLSQEAMIAGDVVSFLPQAFLQLNQRYKENKE